MTLHNSMANKVGKWKLSGDKGVKKVIKDSQCSCWNADPSLSKQQDTGAQFVGNPNRKRGEDLR